MFNFAGDYSLAVDTNDFSWGFCEGVLVAWEESHFRVIVITSYRFFLYMYFTVYVFDCW